jgi:TusA-related sulfurtransferase
MKELAIQKSGLLALLGLHDIAEALGLRAAARAGQANVTERYAEIPGHGRLSLRMSLDFMGDTCLRTNLVTKRALAEVLDGAVIEIVTDNLSSVETIPFMSPNYNGAHLATVHAESCWKIYIRKGDGSAPAGVDGADRQRG